MVEEYHKWYSGRIGQEYELLTFGTAGVPLLLFPTSKGTYYQYKDFGLIKALATYIETQKIKVYCLASYDAESWYNTAVHPAQRVQNHLIFDDLVLNEVVYRAKFETHHKKVMVAGCSMGGFHAINFAFRHPDEVSYAFSMSGLFDNRMFLDGYYDQNAYYNNPIDFMSNLGDGWFMQHIQQMGIVLGVGENDFCKASNFTLANILQHKNIAHWLDVKHNGEHDWGFWLEALPHYLSTIKWEK